MFWGGFARRVFMQVNHISEQQTESFQKSWIVYKPMWAKIFVLLGAERGQRICLFKARKSKMERFLFWQSV